MTHWNHRVIQETLPDGKEWFSVREVIYNDDGSIYAYTENPVDICGNSVDEIREYCQRIIICLDKGILVDGHVEFVDPKAEQKKSMSKHE